LDKQDSLAAASEFASYATPPCSVPPNILSGQTEKKKKVCYSSYIPLFLFVPFRVPFFIFYFSFLSLSLYTSSIYTCNPMSAFKSVSPFLFIGMNFLFHLLCSSVPSPPSAGQGKAGKLASNGFASQQNLPCHDSCTPPCTCEFLTCASRHTRSILLLLLRAPS
jgi:hypothetical protein